MVKFGFVRFGFCLLGICLASLAKAYDVGPLVHSLDLDRGKLGSSFTVSNPSDRLLTVEVSAFELVSDDLGVRLGNTANDALLVFPPAMRIEAGASQAVRFQLDPAAMDIVDRSFLLVVDQLPISESSASSASGSDGISVLLSFNVVVHVSASNSVVNLEISLIDDDNPIQDARTSTDQKPPEQPRVLVKNVGTANAFGQYMKVTLHTPDGLLEFSADALMAANDDLFIPPGGQRVVRIPLNDASINEFKRVDVSYVSAP